MIFLFHDLIILDQYIFWIFSLGDDRIYCLSPWNEGTIPQLADCPGGNEEEWTNIETRNLANVYLEGAVTCNSCRLIFFKYRQN